LEQYPQFSDVIYYKTLSLHGLGKPIEEYQVSSKYDGNNGFSVQNNTFLEWLNRANTKYFPPTPLFYILNILPLQSVYKPAFFV